MQEYVVQEDADKVAAKDLIKKLADPEKSKRLKTPDAIKNHEWFQSIVWEDIMKKKTRNPSPLYNEDL